MTHAPARSRRGSTATIVALGLLPLLGFTAMAVDWGGVYTAKTQLQVATDAAAVAAVAALPDADRARSVAKAYAAQVHVRGEPITLTDDEIQLGTWDGATFTETTPELADVVKVTGHLTVSMPITTLFGVSSVTLTAVSGGGGVSGGPAPDLVIVQDVTGSFAAEIDEARSADLTLVDCIKKASDSSTKVGLVSFTGFEKNMLAPSTLITYEDGYDTVVNRLTNLSVCGNAGQPACSGTNIASGLYEAKYYLDNSPSDAEIGRAALLVSDGAPQANATVCQLSNGQYKSNAAATMCPGWANSPTDAKLKSAALSYRDQFEAAGYDLYTVFYNETSDPVQTAFMESMTAGDGIYLESPDPADLGNLLTAICHAYVRTNPGLVF